MRLRRILTASSCRRDDRAADHPGRQLQRHKPGSRSDHRCPGNDHRAIGSHAARICVVCARTSWGRT